MNVMFDTNVLLDVFQHRQPHYRDSALCLNAVMQKKLEGWIAAHAITTFYYLLERHTGEALAREAVQWLLDGFYTAPCDHALLQEAIASEISDFEDAVLAFSAAKAGCTHIITRNVNDFLKSPVPAVSPSAFLNNILR